jgi:HlyD family secretion protein
MCKVKPVSIVLAALAVAGMGVALAGCGGNAATATAASLTATVTRGNIVLDVTAAGNLSLSTIEKPAFETAGTVAEVLVSVSDSVKKGDVLARLDSSTLDDQISQLQDKVDAAESQVTAKEDIISQDEDNLTKAREVMAGAPDERENESILVLQTAAKVAEAQITVDEAPQDAEDTLANLNEALYNANTDLLKTQDSLDSSRSYEDYQMNLRALHVAELKVANAQKAVDDAPAVARKELATRQQALQQAQIAYNKELKTQAAMSTDEELQAAIDKVQKQLESDQKALDKARAAVISAQKDLDDAKQTKVEVTAPFDGFITKVNVAGGNDVAKGTVAVEIADPTRFQVGIMIGESNISEMKLGGKATVTIDSISGLSYPATISFISPTSTNSSGVVKYQVTVDVDTANPQFATQRNSGSGVSGRTSTATSSSTDSSAPASITARFTGVPTALPSGMTLPSPPSGMTRFPTALPTPGQDVTAPVTATTTSAVPFQLKEGLSVSVSVILMEKDNVLMVPLAAVVRQSGGTFVIVPSGETTKEIQVSVGVSDYQHTEITGGLNEGDSVVYTQSTTSANSNSTNSDRPNGGGMRIPF